MATLATRITLLSSAVSAKIKSMMPRLLPTGGTAGQVLVKNSTTDFDASFASLGTAATANTGTSGHAIPFLDAAANSFTNGATFGGVVTASNLSGTNTGDQTTISGNAGSATKLATARTIATTGDVTFSGSFDGTANLSAVATLASVNSGPGTYGSAAGVPVVTVDAKGRVSSIATAALGTAATANTGTSGHAVPFLDAANTFSASQTVNGLLTVNMSGGNYARFSNGASAVTPAISIGTSAGKSLALLVGTNGTAFTFDNSGTFAIAADTKANIDGGTSAGGTSLLSMSSGGNATLTGTFAASNFSGSHSGTSSGTNTGDQTNIAGNAATATNVAWTGVTGKPTTLSGYGITDAPTATGSGASGSWAISITGNAATASQASAVAWGNVTGKPFNYSGQSGQPSWLWGTNDGSNYYVWNPSNFNVNSATYHAGNPIGTSGTAVPLLSNANTWAASQTLSAGASLGGALNFASTPLQVGYGVAGGIYGDAGSLALRALTSANGSTIYFQSYNGASTFATMSVANGFGIASPVSMSSTLSVTGQSNLAKVYAQDVIASRSSNQGVLYLGTDLSSYVYNDGTYMHVTGRPMYVDNGGIYANGSVILPNGNARFQVNDGGATGNGLWLCNTSAGTDAKYSRMYNSGTNGSNTLVFDFMNDAGNAASTWLYVNRSGYSPTAIGFQAPVSFNSSAYAVGYMTAAGGLTVGSSMIVNAGGIQFNGGSGGATVGNSVSTGVFLDGSNVGFRTYGNNGIYFQNGGGGTTYAYVNSGGFNVSVPLYIATGQWNNSSDGVNRFYYGSGAATYYNAGGNSGSGDRHVFRTGQNDRFYINTDGSVTLVGGVIYTNNGAHYLQDTGGGYYYVNQGFNSGGPLCNNGNYIYLQGWGDTNHTIGSGSGGTGGLNYYGTTNGEAIRFWDFFALYSVQLGGGPRLYIRGQNNQFNSGWIGMNGIADPQRPLENFGTISVNGINGGNGQYEMTSGNRNVMLRNDGNNFYLLFSDDAGSSNAARSAGFNGYRPLRLDYNGNMNFNSENSSDSFFGRNMYVNGYVQASSDRKLKTNIETIDGVADKLNKLNGVTFNWKSNGVKNAGLIAQELEAVAPELVEDINDTDLEGKVIGSHKTANYQGFTAYLLEGWKAHEARIAELEAQVVELLANGGRLQ